MDNSEFVLHDSPVDVRDSWDVLDTPRVGHGERDSSSDESLPTQRLSVNIKASRSQSKDKHLSQKQLRRLVSQSKEGSNRLKSEIKYESSATKNYFDDSGQRKVIKNPRYKVQANYRPKSATNTSICNSETSKLISRRYRRLELRTHDEMLQEQFDQLRHLLKDSENMSKQELCDQHLKQTKSMIAYERRDNSYRQPQHNYYAGFQELTGGSPTRKIIISRSLPETLRPKSPRSSSSSSIQSPSPRASSRSGFGSSRSPSPQFKKSSKKVSFKMSSRNKKKENGFTPQCNLTNSEIWSTDSELNSDEVKTKPRSLQHHRESSSASDSEVSEEETTASNKYCTESTENKCVNATEQELAQRIKTREIRVKHQYITTNDDTFKVKRNQSYTVKSHQQLSLDNAKGNGEKLYGTGTGSEKMKSDSNLRRTANPEVKQWLKEKERVIKQMKKKQRQKEEKEKKAKELEIKQKNERKLESDKHLKDWNAAKRKQARLLKRQNKAKRKLITQQMSASENDLTKPKEQVRSETTIRPTAPTVVRPRSAPSGRRRNFKPQQIPLQQVIQNSPDLQQKMKQLEKQKQFKHRQSYDEWLKVKEQEKKEALKVIREKRLKLEKEISEETARVISEAAKRRMDNVRYKGSTSTKEETTPTKEQSSSEKATSQKSYTWRKETLNNKSTDTTQKSTKKPASRSTSLHNKRCPRPANRRTHVEDKITTEGASNPFSDPFKPPKLQRPKSQLEQNGVNGPEFSRFIWDLVNEQEKGGNRPEPQGADCPAQSSDNTSASSEEQPTATPEPQRTSSPPPPQTGKNIGQPVIESGKTIFSMTSIE